MGAADEPVRITGVEIGFDGLIKVGRWTIVEMQLEGAPGATVETAVVAPDPEGSPVTWSLSAVTLDSSGRGVARGLFRTGRMSGVIRVHAGGATAMLRIATEAIEGRATGLTHRQDVAFVGVLGSAPGFVEAYRPAAEGEGPRAIRSRVIEFASSEDLPETREAYDSIDLMVVSQVFAMDAVRSQALNEWVQGGGHLVVAMGSAPDAFAASPLRDWVPVSVSGRTQFRELAALVRPGSPALPVLRSTAGLRLESPQGIVLADSLDGPLALRCAHGLGRVTLFAVDWSQPPLSTWEGLPALGRFLADLDLSRPEDESRRNVQLRPTGVSEMTTQLLSALDSFSNVHRPSYWTIISLSAAFLLLIGPLDYLLVHQVLKNPRATWFTFPSWIVFAVLAANYTAERFNAAERQLNQFDMVDLDTETGLLQVQSWSTLYSPAPRRFSVQAGVRDWLDGSATTARAPLSWAGSPETGFGGMYRGGGLNLADTPYAIDTENSEIRNIPVGQWSTKSLSATWRHAVSDTSGPLVTSDLADDGTGYLVGSLTHRLPDELTDWCLAYGRAVYYPRVNPSLGRAPPIPPGLEWTPQDASRRQLRGFLRGERTTYAGGTKSDGTTLFREEYDPLDFDPVRWARTLTFHRAAGSYEYAGLTNSALEHNDLSHLLNLKRAILFGRIRTAAADYTVDGSPIEPQEQFTFVRIVLPVKPAERG